MCSVFTSRPTGGSHLTRAGGCAAGYPSAGHYPQSGYDELDSTLMASRGQDPYGPSMLPPGHGT